MVNKIAVGLVGGLVLVAVIVVGGVAAFVLGGGGQGGAASPTDVDHTALPPLTTATATASPAPTGTRTTSSTPTARTTPTVTSTPTPRGTVLPSQFDAERIEVLIARLINDRRRAAGVDPLARNSTTPNRVSRMAREHSRAMAEAGRVAHVIDGNTSTDRYRAHQLYTTCQWRQPGGEAFSKPDANGITDSENGFEAVGRTIAGREYEVDGETRFNGDERAVARAIVEQWWETTLPRYADRLTLPNARYLGVGVYVTRFGEVYATANLC